MTYNHKSIIFSLCLLLVVASQGTVLAQLSLEKFGKNRVQYKNFDWRYFSSDNFDVYFYDGGAEAAREAIDYLESEFERLTDILGYAPYSKTKIFLYNSITDLQQSNVGVNENQLSVAGQTTFVKTQAEIAFTGINESFKKELLYKVSGMMINEMMYGGSLTDMFQSSYLLSLPDWFVDGAARYISYGWSVDMDDHIRDLLYTKKFKKFSNLTGEESGKAGQSMWNFIVENYGLGNISNVLNLTRIIRNEENSLASTLGMPFKSVTTEWQNYYLGMAAKMSTAYSSPPDSLNWTKNKKTEVTYNSVKLSPDARYMAYTSNNNGKYKVNIVDISSGKEINVLSGGYRVINQEVDRNMPLINWKDENTLGMVYDKVGRSFLTLYDLESKSKEQLELTKFSNVSDFSFSDKANVAVLSATAKGQNDLYLLSINRNSVQRLTFDKYDDLNPAFLPNSAKIVFSSNRLTDTLKVDKVDFNEISNNFNIFLYDLDTTKTVLARLTNTLSEDIQPLPVSDEYIFYLSDQKGIFNLYRYNFKDKVFNQVTSFSTSIKDFDLVADKRKFAFSMLNNGADQIFLDQTFDVKGTNFTPQTSRQELLQAKFIAQRINAHKLEQAEREKEISDSLQQISTDMDTVATNAATDIIDTDDYVFETDVVEKEEKKKPSFLTNYRRLQKKSKVLGPLPYETRFSADNVITSFVIDPYRGFGILLEAQMNDMLENHRFYGGLMAITDLKSGDIFAEYDYLKYKVDFRARFDRNVIRVDEIDENQTEVLQKYALNKIEVGASLPLSVTSRFSVNPFYAATRYLDLNFNNLSPTAGSGDDFDVFTDYAGVKLEYVFDNSVVKGLNILQGSRAKATFEHFEGLKDSRNSFSRFVIDARHHQRIHKEITFATRLFYGRTMGKSKPRFLLGGVDNWINKDTQEDTEGGVNPLDVFDQNNNSDLLFVKYVTNLRGFDYNEFNGTNALLFNAELRLPIVKYLHSGPISSNFFRNLQFIGFYDIGSAWEGNSPFARENSLNTQIITESSFEVTVNNFKNPWLMSYGAGVRTVLLGYYLRFDVAWPVEDYDVGSPKYHFSLGYDF